MPGDRQSEQDRPDRPAAPRGSRAQPRPATTARPHRITGRLQQQTLPPDSTLPQHAMQHAAAPPSGHAAHPSPRRGKLNVHEHRLFLDNAAMLVARSKAFRALVDRAAPPEAFETLLYPLDRILCDHALHGGVAGDAGIAGNDPQEHDKPADDTPRRHQARR